MKVKTALISVYDKAGIVNFGKELKKLGIEVKEKKAKKEVKAK